GPREIGLDMHREIEHSWPIGAPLHPIDDVSVRDHERTPDEYTIGHCRLSVDPRDAVLLVPGTQRSRYRVLRAAIDERRVMRQRAAIPVECLLDVRTRPDV